MEMQDSASLNYSVGGVYHVDNKSIQFVFFLEEVSNLVQHQFKRHFLYSEGFMLKYLRKRRSSIKYEEIRDLLAHLHTPLVYAYMLLGGILISLLAIPYICCFGSCTMKAIDSSKLQCCFPVEVMFYVLSATCLLIGITGLCQIIIQIHDGLATFPNMWKNMVQDILENVNLFKGQVRSTVGSLANFTDLIIYKTRHLPKNVTHAVLNAVNWSKIGVPALFSDKMLRDEFNVNKLDFVVHETNLEHLLEVTFKEVINKTEVICDVLSTTQKNVFRNNVNLRISIDDILQSLLTLKQITFPHWKIVYEDLQVVFQDLLPAANESLFFADILDTKLQSYTKTELHGIESAARNLQELAYAVEQNITRAIQDLSPHDVYDAILDASHKTEQYMRLMDAQSKNFPSRITNGNFWAMMIPPFYAIIVFTILVVAFVVAIRELRKIISNTWSPPSQSVIYTLKLFRISMIFSVSFLWLMFISTAVFYCVHLPVSVFCESLNDDTIFKQYVDKPDVWDNKTWLDNKLFNYLPEHQRHLKVKDVLDNCYRNESLYNSLYMHEYWNISQYIQNASMKANLAALHTMAIRSIDEVKMPDLRINLLIKKIAEIVVNLEMPFVPDVIKNIEFIFAKLEDVTLTTINELPRNFLLYDIREQLKASLNEIRRINEEKVPYMLRNISKMLVLKHKMKKIKDELKDFTHQIPNMSLNMLQVKKTIIPTTLNKTATELDLLINKMQMVIHINVENSDGNCYVLPFVYDKAVWSLCHHGLKLVNGLWITLGIISVSIACSIVLSCRMAGYIRGINAHYCPWRRRLESQRYSSQTAQLNSTILIQQVDKPQVSNTEAKTQLKDRSDDIIN